MEVFVKLMGLANVLEISVELYATVWESDIVKKYFLTNSYLVQIMQIENSSGGGISTTELIVSIVIPVVFVAACKCLTNRLHHGLSF